jgi:hypothetical protein
MLLGLQSISFSGSDVAGMTSARFIFEIIESMSIGDADLHRGAVEQKQK